MARAAIRQGRFSPGGDWASGTDGPGTGSVHGPSDFVHLFELREELLGRRSIGPFLARPYRVPIV